jgi:serine/threonine-protein kinase
MPPRGAGAGGASSGSGRFSPVPARPLSSITTQGNYRVFSKYRLLARLGSGGMAEVFLAVTGNPAGFNKLQVLKVLRSDLPEQERADFARMFHDEARLAARLSHPNIVQSHEVGSEEGHDFIAMEFLEGQPLSHLQERTWEAGGAEFTLEMQLQVLCCVLEALDYAHGLRDYDGRLLHIVHRDVSPQNIFVTYAGHAKLVDFGIAKTLESNKTRAGVVKGKVPYMSPEQVLGGAIDHRADLFSVGVILWEAVARRHMHGTASVYEILRSVVQGSLPSLREAAPDVPPEFERIVKRALSRRPEDRHADASSFRDELLAFLDTRKRVSTRELGERVSSMFAKERAEIAEVIRQAMSEVNDAEAEYESGRINAVHLLPTLQFLAAQASSAPKSSPITAPTTAPSLMQEGNGMSIDPHRSSAPSPDNVSAPPLDVSRASGAPNPPNPRKKRWSAAAFALGALAVALLLVVALRPRAPAPASNASPGASTAPVAPVKAATLRLHVRAVPEAATLALDGTRLRNNPIDTERPRDGSLHTLIVSAPGYDSRSIPVRFDHDLDLEVRLAEAPRPAASAAPPSRPSATAKPVATVTRSRPAPAKRPDDLYQDFPERKRTRPAAPALDTSESPW